MVAERPSKDRRKIAERKVGSYVENQEVAIVRGWLMQCADSQVVRYCGKEGTKNPHRREKECGNAFMNAFSPQGDSLQYFLLSKVLFTAFCFISKVFITLSGVAGIPQGLQSRQNAEMWECVSWVVCYCCRNII